MTSPIRFEFGPVAGLELRATRCEGDDRLVYRISLEDEGPDDNPLKSWVSLNGTAEEIGELVARLVTAAEALVEGLSWLEFLEHGRADEVVEPTDGPRDVEAEGHRSAKAAEEARLLGLAR